MTLKRYFCNMICLYHGSDHIVSRPFPGGGSLHNDYGTGFYCTEHLELAREWSCLRNRQAFVNHYELDQDGLKILHLSRPPYHILNWLAILVENRTFDLASPLGKEAKDYLLKTFLPAYEDYDVIIGYRADDSYFSFARDFLGNAITLEQLRRAMHLGKLGEQVVIKSQKASHQIKYLTAEPVDTAIYGPLRRNRDLEARAKYRQIGAESFQPDGVYMVDILRNQWGKDDARLR